MNYGRGYVYDLYYHIVWCVKYRKKVLTGDVKESLIEINTDLDHVHLLIGLSPQDQVPIVMKTLKGVSARQLNKEHKDVLKKNCGVDTSGHHHII